MSRILCIFPDDYSTQFLNRVQTYLKREWGEEFHCFKVKPNKESHDDCIDRLRTNVDEEFVIFFGHGGSDYLYGATNQDISLSESIGMYGQESPFSEEQFINRANIGVFAGKKIFCFSCASAPVLARLAVQNGAEVFLGFGSIPTEAEEFKEGRFRFPLELVRARFKAEIVWIVKHSLNISLKRSYSFEKLASMVRLLTHYRINQLITTNRNLRERRIIADYLFTFLDQMMIVGDRHQGLTSLERSPS